MDARFELTVLHDGQIAHAVPLQQTPLRIGRAPSNDLVLSDDSVSWHHAQVWLEGGRPWVRDLGSRNGTFVNDERIRGSQRLEASDVLRLGPSLTFGLRGASEALPARFRVRHLIDVASGTRLSMTGDRFRIGTGSDCDLRLEQGPNCLATVLLHDNGEIWVGTADGDAQLEADGVFVVGGRSFQIVEDAATHAPTLDFQAASYPYALSLRTEGYGPHAVLSDGPRELLLTGNRGLLAYVLGRALLRHREEQLAPSDQGWCPTTDVLTQVWGRGQASNNHLNVLVHRTRHFLQKHDFDPWCIEKRRGAVRLRLRHVEEG